jgi:hypothetical protein
MPALLIEDIERRMIGGDLCGDALDGSWIADIELDGDHAGIGIAYGLQVAMRVDL